MRITFVVSALMILVSAAFEPLVVLTGTQDPARPESPLTRRYHEGERLSYRMTATNRDRTGTTRYEATARGVVKRDNAGNFFEEYKWTDIVWNGAAFELPPASRAFRQVLSLSPQLTPSLPDFSRIDSRLVGPTADLMTFYSDVWLAMRQTSLSYRGSRRRDKRTSKFLGGWNARSAWRRFLRFRDRARRARNIERSSQSNGTTRSTHAAED